LIKTQEKSLIKTDGEHKIWILILIKIENWFAEKFNTSIINTEKLQIINQ